MNHQRRRRCLGHVVRQSFTAPNERRKAERKKKNPREVSCNYALNATSRFSPLSLSARLRLSFVESSDFQFSTPGSISSRLVVFPSTSLDAHTRTHTHVRGQIDSVSMKKDDAIEDDDNSRLTFTNLLSREMGMEGRGRKGGRRMDR